MIRPRKVNPSGESTVAMTPSGLLHNQELSMQPAYYTSTIYFNPVLTAPLQILLYIIETYSARILKPPFAFWEVSEHCICGSEEQI